MTISRRIFGAHHEARKALRPPRRTKFRHMLAGGVGALALLATFAIAPAPQSRGAQELQAYIAAHPQSVKVSSEVGDSTVKRDVYSGTPGIQSLTASGTNYDWAKLVMHYGGWPQSDSNVTVMVRWMRQENGTNDWWNRNNPMNNGYGSGGGAGLGSYANLTIAAKAAADNLRLNSSYATIVAAFAVSAPTGIIEQAIWDSPWATSHYGNGANWHTTPVDQVKSPAGTW